MKDLVDVYKEYEKVKPHIQAELRSKSEKHSSYETVLSKDSTVGKVVEKNTYTINDKTFYFDHYSIHLTPSVMKIARGMYLKLARIIHPDKCSNPILKRLFPIAHEYYTKKEIAGLLSVCIRASIDISVTDQDFIRIVTQQYTRTKKELLTYHTIQTNGQ